MRAMKMALALLLASTGVTAAAQTPAADKAERTGAGATFTAPAAWSVAKRGPLIEIAAPERDFTIAIIDVGAAADAKAAVAAGWAAWKPAAARAPKLVTARPPRNGWEERQVIDYEVSPNEKRALQAVAFRRGTAWTVAIFDGAEATAEKRLAAVGLVSQSLRPAGYARESFAGKPSQPMDAARIAELRGFVETAMKELDIPGASFAITDRSRTLYAGGIGARELGKPTPVDADTQFMIASNTKGMATLLLAKLVDEGKLGWEQPVTQVYPAFRLGSDAVTKSVLVRHLVCACTGLPRKDMQVILNSDPRAAASDTFVQLAATQPTSGFGEVFQYNNLMAAAAGYVGANLVHPGTELGSAFERSMDEKVFGPLGMTATTFSFERAMGTNWARPHGDNADGRPVTLLDAGMALNRAFARYAGAGGAWSTAGDLIKYVRFELNEGKLDAGQQYVSAKNVLQRRVANVPVGEDRVYGMGMQVDRDYGVDVVHHGGSLAGYKSDIMLIPEAGIGAVILTNSENGGALLRPFQRKLLELIYDGKPEAAADVAASAKRMKAEIAKERELISPTPDAGAVAALAPAYVNAELGRLETVRDGAGVTFRFRTLASPMGTKKNADGSTSFLALDPTLLFFPLVVGRQGDKRTLILRDSQHEFVFTEAAS
jgi:CubicO group peptidase (beta-lactamase class C family)